MLLFYLELKVEAEKNHYQKVVRILDRLEGEVCVGYTWHSFLICKKEEQAPELDGLGGWANGSKWVITTTIDW